MKKHCVKTKNVQHEPNEKRILLAPKQIAVTFNKNSRVGRGRPPVT